MAQQTQAKQQYKNLLLWIISVSSILFLTNGYAEDTLGSMADSIHESLKQFEAVIGTGSYVVGLAFAIGAIMKFKQHKDNPSNIPIGTPIALLFVAVALVFLPSLISLTGTTMTLKKSAGQAGTFDLKAGS